MSPSHYPSAGGPCLTSITVGSGSLWLTVLVAAGKPVRLRTVNARPWPGRLSRASALLSARVHVSSHSDSATCEERRCVQLGCTASALVGRDARCRSDLCPGRATASHAGVRGRSGTIAFLRSRSDVLSRSGLFAIRADGTGLRRLTAYRFEISAPMHGRPMGVASPTWTRKALSGSCVPTVRGVSFWLIVAVERSLGSDVVSGREGDRGGRRSSCRATRGLEQGVLGSEDRRHSD